MQEGLLSFVRIGLLSFGLLSFVRIYSIYIHTYTDPMGQSWPRGIGSVDAGQRVSRR